MIEKWVIFKRDYLEISFLRENCGYDGSDERRRWFQHFVHRLYTRHRLSCGVKTLHAPRTLNFYSYELFALADPGEGAKGALLEFDRLLVCVFFFFFFFIPSCTRMLQNKAELT